MSASKHAPPTVRRALLAVGLALVLTAGLAHMTAAKAGAAAAAPERCHRATGPTYYAPGSGRTVALTFDDGPSRFTLQVLRILRRHGVRATFFITGRHAATRPRLLRQVVAEGHLIAGHSYDHDYPSQVRGGWTRRYIGGQMDRTDRVLSGATGKPVCFFRPPGGNRTSGMYGAARARGVEVVLWSVSSGDSGQPGMTSAAATRRLVANATAVGSQSHPLVLLHDGKASHEPERQISSHRGNTVAALPRIIRFYRARGFRFVDVAGGSGLPPESTSLRVIAAPGRVPAATESILNGALSATTGPMPSRDVRWSSRRSGARRWIFGGIVRSRPSGGFRLQVQPRFDTDYRFAIPATNRYRRAATAVTVTTYTIATNLRITGEDAVVAGDQATLRTFVGSQSQPRSGVAVFISRRVDGVVVTDRVRTDAEGRATFIDRPEASTHYTLQVRERLPFRSASATHDVTVHPGADPSQMR